MGVPNPDIFLYHLPDSQTGFLIYMYMAGQQSQVPIQWTPEYFTALCNYLDGLYLAATTLNTFFKYIKKLALAINQEITTYQYAEFDVVLACAKLPIDNKWPVSQEFLQELCAAADLLFEEYDATLAKVMMMTAWACFMRVSEYTNSKAYKDHNVEVHAVDITDDGIGIIFESDKTSKVSTQPKHCLQCWEFLPKGACQVYEKYLQLRPRNVVKFFIRTDGRQLSRDDFCDFLDACLLLTRWHWAHIITHSLRVGGGPAMPASLDLVSSQYSIWYGGHATPTPSTLTLAPICWGSTSHISQKRSLNL